MNFLLDVGLVTCQGLSHYFGWFECLDLVGHVVKVNGNGHLVHELQALNSDLRELLFAFCNCHLINAALLPWFVNLRRYNFAQR